MAVHRDSRRRFDRRTSWQPRGARTQVGLSPAARRAGVEGGRGRLTKQAHNGTRRANKAEGLGKKLLLSMNTLVNNVAYALFAAGPLPMLGPGADMRRRHGFQRGKAWTATALKAYGAETRYTIPF